jgi:FMN phosphatase YigB (HAD superfamily)
MPNQQISRCKLLVLDIDNTVFDWVTYYVHSYSALLERVSVAIGVGWDELAEQSKEVFEKNGSIEFPFVIQELPAVNDFFKADIDKMLDLAVRPARDEFLKMADLHLKPYAGVEMMLNQIKQTYPTLPVVALTDAPRYVAMWKLNKLGLLHKFDAVYGLPDPKIPVCDINRRVKVDPDILLKHLQHNRFGFAGKIRNLPDDYEKPGVRGLKTVLMDYDLDESESLRKSVLWIGDNLRKDVGLGNKLGVSTGWAEYGTNIEKKHLECLSKFSPPMNIHKNVYLSTSSPDAPKPDFVLKEFADILSYL